jgi:hypothetical protein
MWMLEFLFVLWVGFLVWCLVMLHLVYAEVKRLKTTTVQGVEKGINTEESPAPTSLLRRQAASQTEWGKRCFSLLLGFVWMIPFWGIRVPKVPCRPEA